MRTTRVLGGALVGSLALAGLVRTIRRRGTTSRVETLYEHATAATDRPPTVAGPDFEALPPPVERYVRSALAERKRAVDSVVLRQAGQVRTGDADSPWRPFTATQYVTTDPPGFLWDAAVRFAPLVSVRVRDLYVGGDGSASVSLAGAIPLDGAEASPELNEAELMRYLAEAVWYPTALLPRAGVTWSAIDDETAAATIECGGVSASLTFTFDGDEVRTVHSDGRYRRVDGRYERTPWTGHWRAYEMRNGFRVPTEGDVVWHLPDGDLHAWHGRLEEVSHDRR